MFGYFIELILFKKKFWSNVISQQSDRSYFSSDSSLSNFTLIPLSIVVFVFHRFQLVRNLKVVTCLYFETNF